MGNDVGFAALGKAPCLHCVLLKREMGREREKRERVEGASERKMGTERRERVGKNE